MTYDDVDGIVLTGFTHSGGPGVLAVIASQVEASSIPGLPISNSPDGYLTTAPGARGLFYNLANADPAVVARDEALRSTITNAGNISLGTLLGDAAITNAVRIPVLSIFGAEDRLFNTPGDATTAETEHTYFQGASSHETIVVPEAGHVLPLSMSAAHSNAKIFQWIDQQIS